jgi:hypothetical protein
MLPGSWDGINAGAEPTHVAQLRQKLETDPARPRLLVTKPGRAIGSGRSGSSALAPLQPLVIAEMRSQPLFQSLPCT